MFILKAEPRDTGLKARQLRRKGLTPVCVYGSDIEKSLLFQISQSEADKLLKEKSIGGKVLVDANGEEIHTLLKEINYEPVSGKIEHLNFQKINLSETVSSTAQIVLTNREKIPNFIQQVLFEVPYKVLAAKLVEKIEIDLSGMEIGDSVFVKDLDISKDPDFEILTDLENLVVSIVDSKKNAAAAEELEAADAEAAAAASEAAAPAEASEAGNEAE
jgi:large subunit ribosomal protein L25